MLGLHIPRNYDEALKFDEQNGNTRWQDCTKLELQQLQDYKFFRDQGKDRKIPKVYKSIRTNLIYAIKHDNRHKTRMVADGHLTNIPIESVYSGVVGLR